jgi:hypothetical protein
MKITFKEFEQKNKELHHKSLSAHLQTSLVKVLEQKINYYYLFCEYKNFKLRIELN